MNSQIICSAGGVVTLADNSGKMSFIQLPLSRYRFNRRLCLWNYFGCNSRASTHQRCFLCDVMLAKVAMNGNCGFSVKMFTCHVKYAFMFSCFANCFHEDACSLVGSSTCTRMQSAHCVAVTMVVFAFATGTTVPPILDGLSVCCHRCRLEAPVPFLQHGRQVAEMRFPPTAL